MKEQDMLSKLASVTTAVALLAVVACGKEKAEEAMPAAAAPAATSPAMSSPPNASTLMATAPTTATMATAATSGPLTVNTAQEGDAGDSSWVAQVDIDGDSTAAEATFVWDDEAKILYVAAEDDEVCNDGGVALANTLTAVYANGNAKGAAAGSGWTATYFDATECGATEPVLWGERFDENGMVTAAGVATIDPATGDLVIAAAAADDSTADSPDAE